MNPMQKDVRDFHVAMNQLHRDHPSLEDFPFELRAKLILEEALEFAEAAGVHVVARATDGELVYSATGDARGDRMQDIGLTELDGTGPNHAEMIDALCDILYVTFGAAVSMGIDLAPFFDRVHTANMLKSTGPVREDGKRLKPPGWQPPDIEGLLQQLRSKT